MADSDHSAGTRITIGAAEFLDHVEEQLAWLAIGGECVADYEERGRRASNGAWFYTDHFRCALPWVSLGGDESAFLDSSDGLGVDVGVDAGLPSSRADVGLFLGDFLSKLRRPLCRAQVREGLSFGGRNPKAHLLHSVAVLPRKHDLRSGPCRGMQRVWCQYVELVADREPTHQNVLVQQFALRPDRKEALCLTSGRPAPEDVLRTLALAAVEQNLSEDLWTVELSMSKERTGLAIQTDAVGARDLVNSLGRMPSRKTLVHWVSAHHRRRRSGGDPSMVRAHLRGTQFAVTKHLYATIWPSVEDIDKAANGRRFDMPEAS